MPYEKHNWVNGETITDTKLNHMEDGIASSGDTSLVVLITTTNQVDSMNKTWNEIYNAMASGKTVIARFVQVNSNPQEFTIYSDALIYMISPAVSPFTNNYIVTIQLFSNNGSGIEMEEIQFACSDPDDYPTSGGLS